MDEKLEQILGKSMQMFLKYGIRSVSMDDICREMGISKKTLYAHFENKSDLLEHIIRFSHQREHSQFMECKESNLNAIDKLLKVSQMVSENIKQYNPSILFELEKYYPALYQMFKAEKKEHIYQNVVSNIRQGKQEGLYREELDEEVVALLYIQKLIGLQSEEFRLMKEYNPEKMFEIMFENHIRGIANQKGIEYLEKQKESLKNNNNN